MLVSDLIQQARAKGATDEQINQFLSSQGAPTMTPSVPDQTSTQPDQTTSNPNPPANNNGFWQGVENFLPTIGGTLGGIGGGIIGGIADIPTGIIPGALAGATVGAGLGGGLGETAKEALQGQQLNPGSIAAQTGLNAGGTLIGGGIGEGLGALTDLAGNAIGDFGTNLIGKALNLTGRQAAQFAKDAGETIPEFLSKRGLQGVDVAGLANHTGNLQDAYDAVVQNPNIKVSASKILDDLAKEIDNLNSSVLPADQAKAKVLQTLFDNFGNKYGTDSQISADTLTALRRGVDANVKDFGVDPMVRSPLNTFRTILQDNLQKAAGDANQVVNGMPLKDAGQELNKLYNLIEMAEPRQFVGSGKAPFPLGGKDAIAAVIGNIFGGPAGAAAGLGAERALGSRIGTQVLSGGAQLLGKGLSFVGNAMPAIGAGVGQIGASGVGALMPSPSNAQNANDQTQEQQTNNAHNPIILPDGTKVQMDANGNTILPAPQDFPSKASTVDPYTTYVQELSAAGSNTAMQQAATDRYNQARELAAQQTLDPQAKQDLIDFKASVLPQMDTLANLLQTEGKSGLTDMLNILNNGTINYARAQTDPNYAKMVALMNVLGGLSTKNIVGGRLSNFELNLLNAMPKQNDTVQTALAKINQARTLALTKYYAEAPYFQIGSGPGGQTQGTQYMPTIPSAYGSAPGMTMSGSAPMPVITGAAGGGQ